MTSSPFELDRIPRQGGGQILAFLPRFYDVHTAGLLPPFYLCHKCAPDQRIISCPSSSGSGSPRSPSLSHLRSPGNNPITMSDKPISRTASGTRKVQEARAAMKYSGSHAFEDVHTISSTSSFRTHAPLMNRFRRTAIGDSDHSASELPRCLLFFLIALASGVYYTLLWSLVCALESRPCTLSWISQTYSGCTVLQKSASGSRNGVANLNPKLDSDPTHTSRVLSSCSCFSPHQRTESPLNDCTQMNLSHAPTARFLGPSSSRVWQS